MNRRKLIRQAAVAHLIDKTAAEEREKAEPTPAMQKGTPYTD